MFVDFEDIAIGDKFAIPSFANHSQEVFIKLPFNKAKSQFDGRVEVFIPLQSVNNKWWED